MSLVLGLKERPSSAMRLPLMLRSSCWCLLTDYPLALPLVHGDARVEEGGLIVVLSGHRPQGRDVLG
jgi:hypothetical protein